MASKLPDEKEKSSSFSWVFTVAFIVARDEVTYIPRVCFLAFSNKIVRRPTAKRYSKCEKQMRQLAAIESHEMSYAILSTVLLFLLYVDWFVSKRSESL